MGFGLADVADVALWQTALVAVLGAYVLSQAIAFVYIWTHQGISYSRSLVVTLVVAGLISTVLMLSIGNNLARGFGIVGTLALIRFRTQMPDPLDMIFVFASFAAGVAAGTGNIATGAIGTAVFLLVVAVLQLTGFGSRHLFDGVLRVQMPALADSETGLTAVLQKFCRTFAAVTMREVAQGRDLERVYHVTLRGRGKEAELVHAVTSLPGASGVSMAMQEATREL
jgi:hypothetical protein